MASTKYIWKILIFCSLFGGLLFWGGWNLQKIYFYDEFVDFSGQETSRLNNKLRLNEEVIKSLVSFLKRDRHVSRKEFEIITGSYLKNHPSVRQIEWIPRVADTARPDFEFQARKETTPDFSIRSYPYENHLSPDLKPKFYFPTMYVEPFVENKDLLGMDWNTHPDRIKWLQKAEQSGNIEIFRVKAPERNGNQGEEVVLLAGVFRQKKLRNSPDTKGKLLGFLAVVFDFEQFYKALSPNFMKINLSVHNRSMTFKFGNAIKDPLYEVFMKLPVFSDVWELRWQATENFMRTLRNRVFYGGIMGGGAIILLAGFIAHLIASRLAFAEGKVEVQTLELRNRHELLKHIIEELETTNLQLEEKSRHKSQFLSMMSHELRTPLNSILGFSDLLLGKFFGSLNEKQISYVGQIQTSGKHLLALINDLLDISKIDSGKMTLQLEEINVNETIHALMDMLKTSFSQKDLKVSFEGSSAPSSIVADERKFKQIILNLLSNAIKYTPEGGVIEVKAISIPDELKILVTDTGKGIEEEDRKGLFQDFYQVDKKADEAMGGIGLGLALSKRLVHLHGGEIGVESEIGKGSTFWLTIPSRPPLEAATSGHRGGLAPFAPQAEGKTILLVDDNETNLLLMTEVLSTKNHNVLIARNGQMAIKITETHDLDLILMDMRMPTLNGYDATRKIRTIPKHERVPIIALTATVGEESRDTCLKAGCTDYLAKPVSMAELFEKLDKYLT